MENQKQISFMLIAVLLAVVFVPVTVHAAENNKPVYIVPIGDSITQGGRRDDEYTWRYPLFQILTDAGINFDFVGAYKTGLNSAFKWPDYKGKKFDTDHQGVYGIKTAAMRDRIKTDRKKWSHAPDIALIHLGTNDQGSKDFTADIVEPLRDIIKMLREENPKVVILVGHLNFKGGAAAKIRPLVEKMVKEENSKESPVGTVNHFEGFNADPKNKDTDTYDWAHPNPKGQKKMAEKWFEAMKPFLPGTAAAGIEKKEGEPVYIIPIGDSITQGGRRKDEYTWRYSLFQILTDEGVNFDFVGAYTKGLVGSFKWPDYKGKKFDPDHQGKYGIKTAAMRDRIKTDRKKWKHAPDIALIHLGTNDQKSEDYTKSVAAPLGDIIDMLREENPRVVVFLGHINFTGKKAKEMQAAVEKLAKEKNTKESPVLTVAHYEGFNANPKNKDTDTYDWAHPNPKGQKKMAEKWYEAMKPYL